MNSRNDDSRRVVWAALFGVALLIIALIAGLGLYRTGPETADAGAARVTGGMPASEAAPPIAHGAGSAPAGPSAALDRASVRADGGVVTFYFASGSAELPAGAREALGDVVRGVAAGKTAVVSGYHDSTGDPARNEALASQRALAVRDVLTSLGIGEDKLKLKKPEVAAGGSAAQARRVEVTLE